MEKQMKNMKRIYIQSTSSPSGKYGISINPELYL